MLALVVGSVLIKALPALNLDLFTKNQATFGESGGGIAHAFVGSILLVSIAGAMALPVGVLIAIYVSEFARTADRGGRPLGARRAERHPFDRDRHLRLRAARAPASSRARSSASIALAIIVLPLISRATQEVLKLVPQSLREASQALGVSKWRTVLRVVLPTTMGGILTGATLAVARMAGETAPILFTSTLFTQRDVDRPAHPLATVPFKIFLYSESPDPNLHEQAWAAAFVLIMFVLVISLGCAVLPRTASAARSCERGSRRHAGPFTSLSPPLHRLSAHARRRAADTGVEPTDQGRRRHTHMKRMLTTLAAVLVVGCIAAVSAGAKSHCDRLTGAGSTFVSPLVSLWAADYASKTGTQIAYSPVGSGAGIAAITARQVDFGASDAPLSPDQFNACNGCVQIPWALSATSIIYNLPGVPNNLHMTGAVLANIYLGKITKWDDPAIKALNPKVTLPSTRSRPSTAADNSGTTYNFTDYLSAVSPDWKSKIGVGVNANWPGRPGRQGLAPASPASSANTQGAIGYVDVAFALKNKLKFMSVQNASGRFTTPGLRGITAAAATVKSVPATNEMHIVNPPKADPLAYPICTFTYVILPTKSNKAADLRKFIFYAVNPTQGQKLGPKLLFAPLPKVVLVASEKTLKKIQS